MPEERCEHEREQTVRAQVHATLALVAATVESFATAISDWAEVIR